MEQRRTRKMIQQEVNKIKYIAEDIMEIPFGSIDTANRKRNISLARQVVGAFLVCEIGIDIAKACDLMNRDRTSFYFYKKKHELYMSDIRIYPEYNELYQLLYDRYMSDSESVFKSKNALSWLQQLETLKKQQRDIDKKMYALEQESKLIGV